MTTRCGGCCLEATLALEGPPAAAAWNSGTLSALAPTDGSLAGLGLSAGGTPKESPRRRPAPAAAAADCGSRTGMSGGDGSVPRVLLLVEGPKGAGVLSCDLEARPVNSTGACPAKEGWWRPDTATATARAGVTDRPSSSVETLPPLLGLLPVACMVGRRNVPRSWGCPLETLLPPPRQGAPASQGDASKPRGPLLASPAELTVGLLAGAATRCDLPLRRAAELYWYSSFQFGWHLPPGNGRRRRQPPAAGSCDAVSRPGLDCRHLPQEPDRSARG